EAGEGVVAGDLYQPLLSDPAADLVTFLFGALVVPQDRRAHHLARIVEQHRAVHLAGQPDGGYLVGGDTRLVESLADGPDRRVPPVSRVLLAPQRPGRVVGVLDASHSDDLPHLVDQQRLGGRGRHVHAQHVAHVPSSTILASASSGSSQVLTCHVSRWTVSSPGSRSTSGPSDSSSKKASLQYTWATAPRSA